MITLFSSEKPEKELNFPKKEIFCFFNLHNIWWIRKDKKYSEILKKDFKIFPDGKTLARILKIPQERGPAFTRRYFLSREAREKKHFFIGLNKEFLEKISKITGVNKREIIPYHSLNTKNPKILDLPEKEIKKLALMINKERIDYVWLGISSPKQEIIAKQLFPRTKVKKFICIGAGLDFLLGRKKEAPTLWQKMGVEWLYRLITDFNHSKTKVKRSFLALYYIIIGREKIRR
jgi:N-acetylglucosaminyldiphosphoundecaprenol N-acetyl-beta-D-mannosaminyltransferase